MTGPALQAAGGGGPPLVLASGSAARAAMLRAAGLRFETVPADVDEAALRRPLAARGATAAEAALALAAAKAEEVARTRPGALVLGADQILEHEGEWLEKPAGAAGARAQLRRLSGSAHLLASGAVAVRGGATLWRGAAEARLAVRPLGEAFLDAYLAAAGDSVRESVGGYKIEGLGAQLFARVEGDWFAILGLPLLPLLEFLRGEGILER